MSGLLVIGVSHKTAPVELRERVALPEGRAVGVLRELVSSEHIHEAVAISTCNRTELYLVVADDVEAETAALGILARQADIRPTELVSHLYSLRNADATRHLFRVTAGLDSMIVGEAEIQGQVKRAYELALVENTTSAFMNRLFREALAAGKRVRTETAIAGSTVSVSSVAVQLAQETLGDLSGRRVVVIGAGETGELTARALTERGVSSVFVANRHYDRAIGLAHRFGGHAVRFESLPAELEQADIVVSSTGSPHHIVERAELEAVMSARQGRPLLLIDIAVPRDIEPVVREIEGVHLRDIDDLQRMVERQLSGLDAEVRRAEGAARARARALRAGWARSTSCRRSPRCTSAARDRAPGAGREQRPLGIAQRGRPRAAGGRRERDREAAVAPADAQPEGTRRRSTHLRVRAGAARAVRPGRAGALGVRFRAARGPGAPSLKGSAEVTAIRSRRRRQRR